MCDLKNYGSGRKCETTDELMESEHGSYEDPAEKISMDVKLALNQDKPKLGKKMFRVEGS